MNFKITAFLLALGLGALPAWGEEVILTPERVLHFDSNLQVRPDGTLQVTETITLTAIGEKIRHGLVRKFPVRYQSNQGRTIEVGFELRQALCNGQPEPYRLEHETGTVLVYVGRKDTLLIPGVYTYTLVYRTRRQLGFFPRHDELYWNVTGSQWPFDIEKATARVDLPTGASILETAAYTGTFGTQTDDVIRSVDEHLQPIFATKRPLHPGEGLTVAASWPRGFVRRPDAQEQFLQDLQDWIPFQGLASLGTLTALLLFYGGVWKFAVRRPRPGAPLLRTVPPPALLPAEVRCLWKGRTDAKAAAAALCQLAVKGFLAIREENQGLSLLLAQNPPAAAPEEQALLQALFPAGARLDLNGGNPAPLQAFAAVLRRQLAAGCEPAFFKSCRQYLIGGGVLSLAGWVTMVCLATDAANTAGLEALWLFWMVTAVGMLLLAAFQFKTALVSRKIKLWLLCLFEIGVVVFIAALAQSLWTRVAEGLTPAGALACALVPWVHAGAFWLFRVRTPAGQAAADQIRDFRFFLLGKARGRRARPEADEITPALFEAYLPHALALDAERAWSRQGLPQGTAYAPAWYAGGAWQGPGRTRAAAGLSAALTGALTAATAPFGADPGPAPHNRTL
jgi:hypothetical protein